MTNISLIILTILLFTFGSCANHKIRQNLKGNELFVQDLELIRDKYNLPALAAVIVNRKKTIQVAVTGFRAVENNQKVTVYDKFHFGSNTKSMTATLLAKMIEVGNFKWSDTLEFIFSDLKIHRDYKNVTLEQLLRHQGGTTGNLIRDFPKAWGKFWKMQGLENPTPRLQRALLASTVLSKRPHFKIGYKSNYSNTGVSLVGFAIENKLNRSFEKIIKNSLFSKLEMNSCGFGAPGSSHNFNQPRGHTLKNGKIISVKPGPYADNPDAIAPSGKVHCSIIDWGKYMQEHLKGSVGDSSFLKSSSYKKLHTPIKSQIFGLGWLNLKPVWDPEENHIFHNGSNTLNYAEMWLSIKNNYGIAVVTNIGNKKAMKAVRESVKMIAIKYLKHN